MAENTKIEWADHTVNLWWGCAKVHAGCKNCYAEKWSNRKMHDDTVLWGENAPRRLIKSAFSDLTKFQNKAKKENKMVRVFCGSMMDIFEDTKELVNPTQEPGKPITHTHQLRDILFHMIDIGMFPNIEFLFLTKRPKNISKMILSQWVDVGVPLNVWFGTSISDQETCDKYLPDLLAYSANARTFVSIEPQIGHISLDNHYSVDWVIQGGESGPGKRPFQIEWVDPIHDYCMIRKIPYFFKQIDKVTPIPDPLKIQMIPKFYQAI